MAETDRRSFLQLLGAGAAASAFPDSIARALAIPANNRTGTIQDIEHIVILMQENRSFDHYFGTLNGVRGYGDPRPALLDSGKTVFEQPNALGQLMPFHPKATNLGMRFLEDLAHNWSDTHAAWNHGKYDGWVAAKGTTTMAHLTREDIPFHYALADAFTVCDAYHCSFLGATDPNRYHMWTGWVGNDGKGGGPVLDNSEAGYNWSTFPEKLEKAGISWKIYQDIGEGLDKAHSWGWTGDNPYIGNYGDTSLLYFKHYQNAEPGSPLYEKARTGTNILKGGTLFDVLNADVKKNKLPQVSWVVAPEAYTEHGNWPANYGAWYVSKVLDALTSNPAVWSKTAFFLMFDENDGLFDHMVPPTPPENDAQGASTYDTSLEVFPGSSSFQAGPIGLGVRVPMLVISPWSKGGWVCSEVFDHTSLIKFIEQRFPDASPSIHEHNITPWRRAVAGDLTAAFDFKTPNDKPAKLPSTAGYAPPDRLKHPDYKPLPPLHQALPKQEAGQRPARAVPYELHAAGALTAGHGKFQIEFSNTGKAAAVFQVRSGNIATGPWTYTVGPRKTLTGEWNLKQDNLTAYDLQVFGPNGFYRTFKGQTAQNAGLSAGIDYDVAKGSVTLTVSNRGNATAGITIKDAYGKKVVHHTVAGHSGYASEWQLDASHGWYDLTVTVTGDTAFVRQLAGHLETGKDSVTDPMIG